MINTVFVDICRCTWLEALHHAISVLELFRQSGAGARVEAGGGHGVAAAGQRGDPRGRHTYHQHHRHALQCFLPPGRYIQHLLLSNRGMVYASIACTLTHIHLRGGRLPC